MLFVLVVIKYYRVRSTPEIEQIWQNHAPSHIRFNLNICCYFFFFFSVYYPKLASYSRLFQFLISN